MFKKIVYGVATVATFAAMVATPSVSLASATLTTLQFENGYTNITRDAGTVADATVRFNLTTPTTVNSVQYEFVGSGEAPGYYNVEPDIINPGANQYVEFPMNLPKHSGTWNLIIRLCGAALPASDQNCHLAPVATHTYNGVVTTNPVVSVPVGTPVPTATPLPGGSNPVPGNIWSVFCRIPNFPASSFPECAPYMTPGTGGGAGDVHLTMNMGVGSRGAEVSALQSFLISEGLLNISAPTGYYGTLTYAAVVRYQTMHNISPTGFCGPLTRASINSAGAQG